MSWIRDHFYTWVFPVFRNLHERGTDVNMTVNMTVEDAARLLPFDPPPPKLDLKLPPELAKLQSLAESLGISCNLGRGTGQVFLLPGRGDLKDKILRNTLLSAEDYRKKTGKKRLLLLGRDVWMYAIMCERRRIPYVFVPEMSRVVAESPACRFIVDKYDITGDDLMLDTGFAGSIQKGLRRLGGVEVEGLLMSWVYNRKIPDRQTDLKQVFPTRRFARNEALGTEYLPKYWKTGGVRDGKPFQYVSDSHEFFLAAVLTSCVWRGLDPANMRPIPRASADRCETRKEGDIVSPRSL